MNAKVKVKKDGRKRRALGWILLTLGVIAAGVWIASGWLRLQRVDGLRDWSVSGGAWAVMDRPVALPAGWKLEGPKDKTPSWRWWMGWESYDRSRVDPALPVDVGAARGLYRHWSLRGRAAGFGYHAFSVVLWPVPLILLTPAALLLRSGIVARRRAAAGKCKSCGYDLAGLGDGAKCPECGKGAGTT